MIGYNQGIAGRTQHTWGYRTSQLGNNRGTGQIKHIFVQPLAGTSSCAYVKARILIEIKKDTSNQINFYQYSETCLVWQSFDFRSHSSAGHGELTFVANGPDQVQRTAKVYPEISHRSWMLLVNCKSCVASFPGEQKYHSVQQSVYPPDSQR